jgi:hypothetical protein
MVRHSRRGREEVRLCLSICDLYALRENANKYRSELGEIYGSFSEGFDTADLVKAQTTLGSERLESFIKAM